MTLRRKIKRVVDGDTFETYRKVRGTNFIRLARINSPEKAKSLVRLFVRRHDVESDTFNKIAYM